MNVHINRREWLRRALLVIAAHVLAVAAAGAEIRVVAVSGDSASYRDGVLPLYDVDIPVINNAGDLAFIVKLSGPLDVGIVRSSADTGSLRVIVRTGDPAPDGNGNVQVVGYSEPVINDAGQVAFYAQFTGTFGPNDAEGILRSDIGSDALTLVARDGQIVEGVQMELRGLILGLPPFALNESGQVAFAGRQGIFLNGTNAPIVLFNQPAPDDDGVFDVLADRDPALNDLGQVAFSAVLRSSSSRQGIFRAAGATIDQIVRQGDPVPDGDGTVAPGNGTFGGLSLPALNNSGEVAFYASLDGVSGPASAGVFQGTDDLVPVVRRGDRVRDGSILGFVNQYVPLNDAGQTALLVQLTGTSGGVSDNAALFRTNGTELVEIARKGDQAPGGDGRFFDFEAPAINNGGQVAFRARIIGTTDAHAIFLYDDQRGLMQVVRDGDCLRGKSITDPRFVAFSARPRRAHFGLNDRGQVAFRFYQGNGAGVAIWSASESGACSGDCSGDGRVTINELVQGVGIALGSTELSACPRFDENGDGKVGISELVRAVTSALGGCPCADSTRRL